MTPLPALHQPDSPAMMGQSIGADACCIAATGRFDGALAQAMAPARAVAAQVASAGVATSGDVGPAGAASALSDDLPLAPGKMPAPTGTGLPEVDTPAAVALVARRADAGLSDVGLSDAGLPQDPATAMPLPPGSDPQEDSGTEVVPDPDALPPAQIAVPEGDQPAAPSQIAAQAEEGTDEAPRPDRDAPAAPTGEGGTTLPAAPVPLLAAQSQISPDTGTTEAAPISDMSRPTARSDASGQATGEGSGDRQGTAPRGMTPSQGTPPVTAAPSAPQGGAVPDQASPMAAMMAAPALPATAAPAAPAPVAAPMPLVMTTPDWPATLATASLAALTPDGGTMILDLAPGDLGALRVTLTLEGDMASVRFQTDTPDAARLLSEAERQLSTEFARQGVTLTGHSALADRPGHSAGQGGGQSGGQPQARQARNDPDKTPPDPMPRALRGVINLIA